MPSPYHKLTLNLLPDELARLEQAAKTTGIPLTLWAKAALMSAAAELPRRRYTARELQGVSARARAEGREWSETELRTRGLPLYWCADWRRRKLDEGASYGEMALEAGVSKRSLLDYIRRHEGIVEHERGGDYAESSRALVESGMTRAEAAAEMGVSYTLAARYTTDLQSDQGRALAARLEGAGPYPATIAQIAGRILRHDSQRAAKWGHEMVREGYLERRKRGLYARTNKVPR